MAQNKHETELITFGFIRDIQSLLPSKHNTYYNIPSDITHIALSYLENYFANNGQYTWKITDCQLVKKMLNAECGEKFESKIIDIARLKWRFEIYPNGLNEELKGFFVIRLRLISLPSIIDSIVICRIFRIFETMAASIYISELRVNEHAFWTKKCLLAELIDLKCQTITIQADICINKVILKDLNNAENVISMTPIKCAWEYPTKSKVVYELKGTELMLFKQSKNWKSMCGPVVDELWRIVLRPNGMDNVDVGFIAIYVAICKPAPKLTVSLKVTCKETGNMYQTIKIYDAKWKSRGKWGWIKLQSVKGFHTLTFVVDVCVLNVHGCLNECSWTEFEEECQISYLLSLKKTDSIHSID